MIIEKGLSVKKYLEILDRFDINFFITDNSLIKDNLSNSFKEELFRTDFTNKKFYFFLRKSHKEHKMKKDVALILLTSGSTGEKKAVMLTHNNLIENTKSILKVLPIKSTDIVNLVLPSSYSFGLSVLNTHLKRGAKIFLHNSPFVGSVIKELKENECSSFYGVPSTFEILINKTNFLENKFPKMKYVAQAGGSLENKYKKKLIKKFKNKFFVMYGTTEASPRLSTVPPKMLKRKVDSIGKPIPGVKFKLFKYENSKKYQLGAKGKNIMKGYFKEDKLNKRIFYKGFYLTGDLAYKDKDDFYFISGRIDETIKRYGYKINIKYIESFVKNLNKILDCKIFLDQSENLILICQVENRFIKNDLKKNIEKSLRNNFATYEIPNKIFYTEKVLKSINKKTSLEDLDL